MAEPVADSSSGTHFHAGVDHDNNLDKEVATSDIQFTAVVMRPKTQNQVNHPSELQAKLEISSLPMSLPTEENTLQPSLCAKCILVIQGILRLLGELVAQQDLKERSLDFNYQSAVEHISQESKSGCVSCQMFYEDLIRKLSLRDGKGIFLNFSAKLFYRKDTVTGQDWQMASLLRCEIQDERLDAPQQGVVYPEMWYKTCVMPGGDDIRAVGSPINLQSAASTIKAWLSECDESHDRCQQRGCELPTRLIAVGRQDGAQPRLVLGHDQARQDMQKWEYAVLSHCWGERKPISQLTRQNFGDYCSCIPLDDLEQTFKDAVNITRDLGFEYLWIDSLCIIQGDRADWQRECGRMAEVYANASVTLAASFSEDAYTGFLASTMRPSTHARTLRFFDTGIPAGAIEYQGLSAITSADDCSAQTPLNARAWVFQERILSRRIVYFGSRQMFFECNTHVTSEMPMASGGLPVDSISRWLHWLKKEPGETPDPTETQPSPFYWQVGHYTAKFISKADDILPALSGVAKRYHAWSGDQYFAGHWRRDFITSLAWKRASPGSPMAKKSKMTLVPPSWSWASLNARVTWDDKYWFHITTGRADTASEVQSDVRRDSGFDGAEHFDRDGTHVQELSEVLTIVTPAVGVDRFGQVNGGCLIVRGQVLKLTLGEQDLENGTYAVRAVYSTDTIAVPVVQDSRQTRCNKGPFTQEPATYGPQCRPMAQSYLHVDRPFRPDADLPFNADLPFDSDLPFYLDMPFDPDLQFDQDLRFNPDLPGAKLIALPLCRVTYDAIRTHTHALALQSVPGNSFKRVGLITGIDHNDPDMLAWTRSGETQTVRIV